MEVCPSVGKDMNQYIKKDDQQEIGCVKETVKSFAENTTAHGLGAAVREKTKFGRAAWLFIFIVACCANVSHLTLLIMKYYDYPYQEVTSVVRARKEFPDVTLCSSSGHPDDEVEKVVNNASTYAHNFSKILRNADLIPAETLANFYALTGDYFENVPTEELDLMGPQMKDFIVQCKFSRYDCLKEMHIKPVYDVTYGKCFRLILGKAVKNVAQAGYSSALGLTLILYVNAAPSGVEKPYTGRGKVAYGNSGARVTITAPGTIPNPTTRGWDLTPGVSTSIALTPSEIHRLGAPYSSCTPPSERLGMYDMMYTTEGCTYSLLQEQTRDTCSCFTRLYPAPQRALWNETRYCGYYDPDELEDTVRRKECGEDVILKFIEADDYSCPPPCEETVYSATLSQAAWPGNEYARGFFDQFYINNRKRKSLKPSILLTAEMTSPNVSKSRKLELVRQNFLRLNVYFMTPAQIEQTRQEAAYDLPDLLSDVGGTLGLWAGFSIITTLEFLRLIISILSMRFQKLFA